MLTASARAAPAGGAVAPNATPFTQLAQGYYYGGKYYGSQYSYRPACPERYYYACGFDPYGREHCGCRPGLGYYLFRYY